MIAFKSIQIFSMKIVNFKRFPWKVKKILDLKNEIISISVGLSSYFFHWKSVLSIVEINIILRKKYSSSFIFIDSRCKKGVSI